ncbi:MAG: hypothetical protein MUF00_07550, partial [Gemmatimonadaceae bacterium]|nr:hypothetical protein [Gemmatimonadaceae bacterium]
ALYLHDNMALETRSLGLRRLSADGADATNDTPRVPSTTVTTFGAALFVPVHFSGARSRRGFFVAPGLIVNRNSFDIDAGTGSSGGRRSATILAGWLDLGFKHTLRGRVSSRHAVIFREGDNVGGTVGVTSGVSIFFR